MNLPYAKQDLRDRVLLIRPPIVYGKGSFQPALAVPVGLLYVAAALEQGGVGVDVYDAACNVNRPFRAGRDGDVLLGDDWQEFEARIREYSYLSRDIRSTKFNRIDNGGGEGQRGFNSNI